jgi:N6-L-threonylcarbamoyladenine synthase
MTILGIETSCDETAISVLEVNSPEDIKIRSNIVSSQIKLHAEFGGVVPNLAAREHVKNINHVFETALKVAGIIDFEKEIDLIAVTHGPGLGPALLVGISFAKTIAMTYNKPLVGTDHMRGHVYSNWLPAPDGSVVSGPQFPALNLIVSGGHTELVLMNDYESFRMIGETMDDAVGEAFDKVARLLDLGYPGGPAISKIAPNGDPARFPLPRPMLHSKNFNFSFSGLKTAVLYLLRDLKKDGIELNEQTKADIASSFQEAAIDVLVQKTIHAAQENGSVSVLLSGGVSANKLLRERLKQEVEKIGLIFSCPPMAYTTDNAAMIAVAGYFSYQKNKSADWQTVNMNANLGF